MGVALIMTFDREDGETLQFMHAQSRVYFYAKLAENAEEYLKNVRITLPPNVVATQVEWNFTYQKHPKRKETTVIHSPKQTIIS